MNCGSLFSLRSLFSLWARVSHKEETGTRGCLIATIPVKIEVTHRLAVAAVVGLLGVRHSCVWPERVAECLGTVAHF